MVANTELQRVRLSGWRTGLVNMLRKENRAWWASRRWLVQGLVWAVFVNGILALFLFALPFISEMTGGPEIDILSTGVDSLFKLAGLFLAGGAVLLVQDAIVGERQLGVTEWLLSKPVTRSAYVLSKLFAHGLGVLVILVGLQGTIAYVLLWLAVGEPLSLPSYLVGMVGLAVHILLYLTLALMMGVLTTSRRTLLGVSLGALLGGFFVMPLIGGVLGTFNLLMPWSLTGVLTASVLGIPLPLPVWLSIGVTAILSVIFVVVTLLRFERLEF